MILGVVLAGGQSSRFGSDKALAELDGHSLIARAVDSLAGWCERVVVAGRATAPAPTMPDWPRAGMGPLAGLAAALRLARDEGYDAVLSLGVDAAALPDNLAEVLGLSADGSLPAVAAYISSQPVIGLWPVGTASAIEAILTSDGRHSMLALAARIGARAVVLDQDPANINTPADLAALQDGSDKADVVKPRKLN
jgi:molybdopterin-guanine dinucleotide biosynthesis protein A